MTPLFVQTLCVLALGIGREQESRDSEPSPTFGQALAGIGDVNGDSVPDFVVSDPGRGQSRDSSFRARGDRGRVWVLSGKDGSTLQTIASENTDDGFGCSLDDVGDLNGDGVHDWIVGAFDLRPQKNGFATVFCGRTASVLFRVEGRGPGKRFGRLVAGVGDLSADGVPDFVVGGAGAPLDGKRRTQLSFFSGRDASLLFRVGADRGSTWLHQGVAPVGDIDEDGHADVALSYWKSAKEQMIQVRSGKDGEILWTSSPLVCRILASGVDCDGDSVVDLIAGGPKSMTLLSGRSGRELKSWKTNVTGPLHFLGDVDGDGAVDILVADHTIGISSGVVELRSSADGERHYSARSGDQGWHFGAATAVVGDVDGDDFPDFVVGSDHSIARGASHVWLRSGRTGAAICRFDRIEDEVLRVDD